MHRSTASVKGACHGAGHAAMARQRSAIRSIALPRGARAREGVGGQGEGEKRSRQPDASVGPVRSAKQTACRLPLRTTRLLAHSPRRLLSSLHCANPPPPRPGGTPGRGQDAVTQVVRWWVTLPPHMLLMSAAVPRAPHVEEESEMPGQTGRQVDRECGGSPAIRRSSPTSRINMPPYLRAAHTSPT